MKSQPKLIEIDGVEKTIYEWSEIHHIKPKTAQSRHDKGADWKTAFTAPYGTKFKPQKPKPKKKKCVSCIYRGYFDHMYSDFQVHCDYMYHMGHRRPCPAKDCTVYIQGPMMHPKRQDPYGSVQRGW